MVSEQPENYTPAEPVGQQLKRAREAKGLSVSAIADQQHLRSSVVQAIETGDYEKIDTELFLKGYVRAYARQVGLNADSVIRDLDVELAPARKRREEALQANPLVDIERRKKRKQRIAKAILWLVLIGFVAFIAIHFVIREQVASVDRVGPDEAVAPSAESAPKVDSDANESLAEPVANGLVSDSPSVESTEEPELTGNPESSDASSGNAELLSNQENDSIQAEVLPDGLISVEQNEVPMEQPQTPDSVEPVAVSSIGRLQMTFSNDCWIRVTDATGQRLASGLRRQGDRLDVRGTPPLKVVVGAMNAVEVIQFQDETLDKDNFRVVNNRSEFTLEP
ncbi:RodZ family helix-turn-helix domain-containing protein [Marinobacter sp.]|uniref:RodZ family helix-turn-helix domain-containing protein n=1 Tax=Marinobacter sp. TaxID=50741 RepID=UPI002B266908|nr:RodZ family helix-turn-helix domain-containing protein [Marinobacter sp.]